MFLPPYCCILKLLLLPPHCCLLEMLFLPPHCCILELFPLPPHFCLLKYHVGYRVITHCWCPAVISILHCNLFHLITFGWVVHLITFGWVSKVLLCVTASLADDPPSSFQAFNDRKRYNSYLRYWRNILKSVPDGSAFPGILVIAFFAARLSKLMIADLVAFHCLQRAWLLFLLLSRSLIPFMYVVEKNILVMYSGTHDRTEEGYYLKMRDAHLS